MRILFAGDVVGSPARKFLQEKLPRLRIEHKLDVIIVNGENAAAGSGLTKETAQDIFSAGVDLITTGDHIFKRKESRGVLETMDVVRPLNQSVLAPGRGFMVKNINGIKVGVVNLLGRVFMPPVDCPFQAVKNILENILKETPIVIVDMHAEATSEKLAMGFFLAGKVSAVLGTHTHIPTADERIIDGTAYITDCGMTGSFDSILGRDKAAIVEKFVTNLPVKFNLAQGDVRLQGVIIDVDEKIGRASKITRIEVKEV
jgi:metallophosphoesterase (TIGR00282 family)